MQIPNEFHYFWHYDVIPEPVKAWIESWKKYNPNGKFTYWTDKSVLSEMKKRDPALIDMYIKCKSLFGRMKIAEYYILDTFGGIFFEIDTRCMRSFEQFLDKKFICSLEPDEHAQKYDMEFIVGSAVVGCRSKHKIWRTVFELISENLQKMEKIEDPEVAFGSVMFTKAIEMSKDWIDDEAEFYPSEIFYPITNQSTLEDIKKTNLNDAFCVHYWKDYVHPSSFIPQKEEPTVMIAILARNKAHVLTTYLQCLTELDYSKDKIHIFIHTNDNTDDTLNILLKWVEKVENEYATVEMVYGTAKVLKDDTSSPHNWGANRSRLDLLACIRQHSLQKALEKECKYYFVVDCDNFILPHTLYDLVSCRKPIVAPMLHCIGNPNLSNFLMGPMTATNSLQERKIKMQEKGIFPVSLVHNTYLIDCKYIPKLSYQGQEGSFEFANFSTSAVKHGIAQYICNKKYYGFFIHFFKTIDDEKKLFELHGEDMQKLIDDMLENKTDEVQEMLETLSISNLGWMKKIKKKTDASLDPSRLHSLTLYSSTLESSTLHSQESNN